MGDMKGNGKASLTKLKIPAPVEVRLFFFFADQGFTNPEVCQLELERFTVRSVLYLDFFKLTYKLI